MSADPFATRLREWFEISMRRSMRYFLRHARKSGLSMSHFGALFHIHHQGSSGVTELGEHLGVTSAAISQMLDRLVQQKMISRTEDPNDRRVKQIALTERGCGILEASIHARQAWLDDLSQTLSADDKETIMDALDILIDKAVNLKQPADPGQ